MMRTLRVLMIAVFLIFTNVNLFCNTICNTPIVLGTISQVDREQKLVDTAKQFLGKPYVWGAKGPNSFDCSGLVWYVYKQNGIEIGYCTRTQIEHGKQVELSDARIGDLMFFSKPRGGTKVGHVGMIVNIYEDNSVDFIHASPKRGVVIQHFPDDGHYVRRFLQARRIL